MFKIFSHNDLDGYSINIICNYFNIKADIKNINNKDVDKILIDFFESGQHKKYEKVFLCDIYMSESVAEYIDGNIDNFVLIDHHKTGEFLNSFSWANVYSEFDNHPSCAAELFYDYLVNQSMAKRNVLISEYVESVRLFDTAEYIMKKYNQAYVPEELSILFFIYFRNYWKHILRNLKGGYILSHSDMDVSKNMLNKIDIYARSKQKDIKVIDFNGIKTGVFFIEDPVYMARLLTRATIENPNIKMFMFIKLFNTISLRSITGTDVLKTAEKYGGGGHKFAAGIPYNDEIIIDILSKK